MKQDEIIRWLMDNVDAEALAQANDNGSTITYFAGVAQRFPQANATTPARRTARNTPAVPEERDEQPAVRRQPARQPVNQPAQAVDLNNETETATPARQPARRTRQTNADRIAVGNY